MILKVVLLIKYFIMRNFAFIFPPYIEFFIIAIIFALLLAIILVIINSNMRKRKERR